MNASINAKVFGITAFLLLASTAVAVVSFVRVQLVNREVVSLANYYLPLSRSLNQIGLSVRNQEIVLQLEFTERKLASEADIAAIRQHGTSVDTAIRGALDLVHTGETDAARQEDRIKFAKLAPMIQSIEQQHQVFEDRAQAYLGARRKGEDTQELSKWIAQERENLNQALNRLDNQLAELAEASARDAATQEVAALTSNLIITLTTALIGVALAFWLTRTLMHPLHRLVEGAGQVERGKLDINLPVVSRDEIGTLTQAFNAMVTELRIKERIKNTLGKYIDPRIAEELIAETEQGTASGKRETMTVLFSDIKGFSALAEQLTPGNLVNLLNRYFTLMSEPVTRHGGVIDKYIGDALMAFWGPPFASAEDHARLACLAALADIMVLGAFRKELPEIVGLRRVNEFDIRIGIAAGEVVVGNIGSDTTREYTVIGDAVNLAARLEAACKAYGTHILVNEAAHRMAGAAIETREIDLVRVPGKSEPVRLIEVMAQAGGLDEAQRELCAAYAKALDAYRRMDWHTAASGFETCLGLFPEDGPSRVMLERVRRFEIALPDAWDGIWQVEHK